MTSRAVHEVVVAHETGRCCNNGCITKANAACGGCGFARYCGAACQRAHWRTTHKTTCAIDVADREEMVREITYVREYLGRVPFPSLAEMHAVVEGLSDFEYHNMKEMYDAKLDRDVCKSVGMRLCGRGGIELMRKCYYALRNNSPIARDVTVRSYFGTVELAWDGIGGWQF